MSKTYTKTFTKIGYRAWDNDKDCVLSEEDKEDVDDCYGDIQYEKFKYARRHWRGNFHLSADSEGLIDKICRENEWPGATIFEHKYTLPVEIVEDTDEDGDPFYEAFGKKFEYLFDLVEAIDWRHSDVEPECKVVEEWKAPGRTFYRTFTKDGYRVKVEIVECKDESCHTFYEAFGKKFDYIYDIADAIDWNDVEPEDKDVEGCN